MTECSVGKLKLEPRSTRLQSDAQRHFAAAPGNAIRDADFERDRRWHHIGCFEGELLVAFLGLEEHDVKTLRMRHVAVLEKKQRRGYGTAIVKFSEEFAKSQGASHVFARAILRWGSTKTRVRSRGRLLSRSQPAAHHDD